MVGGSDNDPVAAGPRAGFAAIESIANMRFRRFLRFLPTLTWELSELYNGA